MAITPSPAGPVMQVADLSVVFNQGTPGEVIAFRNVTFELGQEEILAIVGPSGCGKSTLFNVIAGLHSPTSGHVVVKGQLVEDSTGHVGYMLQKDLLLPWRSVLSNVVLGLEVKGVPRQQAEERARKLITRYGLGGFEDAKPATLSGGMRQRVAFMRTLALDPDVVLLDEPFSALDFQTRLLLQREVTETIRRERKSAILVTHDIGEAITMANRVLVLSARPGRVRSIHLIELPQLRDPVSIRREPAYLRHFETIWGELDLPSRGQGSDKV
jgi:NitT/TauT family transport system ATP-binding protein